MKEYKNVNKDMVYTVCIIKKGAQRKPRKTWYEIKVTRLFRFLLQMKTLLFGFVHQPQFPSTECRWADRLHC